MISKLISVSIGLVAMSVLADDQLPQKLQGKWVMPGEYGRIGGATIELVRMDTSDKATVKVTITNASRMAHPPVWCDFGTIQTVAERVDGAWTMTVPHSRCVTYTFTIKAVEAARKFEGKVSNDFGGVGTVSLD